MRIHANALRTTQCRQNTRWGNCMASKRKISATITAFSSQYTNSCFPSIEQKRCFNFKTNCWTLEYETSLAVSQSVVPQFFRIERVPLRSTDYASTSNMCNRSVARLVTVNSLRWNAIPNKVSKLVWILLLQAAKWIFALCAAKKC